MSADQHERKNDNIGNTVAVDIDRKKQTVHVTARFGGPFALGLLLLLLVALLLVRERLESERPSVQPASGRQPAPSAEMRPAASAT